MSNLSIPGPAGQLEAIVQSQGANPDNNAPLAIIAHPHPLYGGSMHNAVVRAAERAFADAGFHTLRFNFRGTGASEGVHDGEQGACADLAAVLDWASGQFEGSSVWLAGYSFGAATILRSHRPPTAVECLLLLAPPLSMHDFTEDCVALRRNASALRSAVIYGELDDLTPTAQHRQLTALSPAFEQVIAGASHDLGSDNRGELRRTIDQAVAALQATASRQIR